MVSGGRTTFLGLLARATVAGWLCIPLAPIDDPSRSATSDPYPVEQNDCRRCHQAHSTSGHPTGVPVRQMVALPLGPGGTVECSSCHEVAAGHPRTVHDAGLRLPARKLCATCHSSAPEGRVGLFHAMALGQAHSTPGTRPATGSDHPDDDSRQCLTCHDGSAARSVISPDAWIDAGHIQAHEFGSSYRAALRRPGRQLRPEMSVQAPVHLVGGRIVCSSCHSAYSRQPRMLHLPLEGSLLCRACHDM